MEPDSISLLLRNMVTAVEEGFSYDGIVSLPEAGLEDAGQRPGLDGWIERRARACQKIIKFFQNALGLAKPKPPDDPDSPIDSGLGPEKEYRVQTPTDDPRDQGGSSGRQDDSEGRPHSEEHGGDGAVPTETDGKQPRKPAASLPSDGSNPREERQGGGGSGAATADEEGKQAGLSRRPASPWDGSDPQGGQGEGGIVAADGKGNVEPGDIQEGEQARPSRRPASPPSDSSDPREEGQGGSGVATTDEEGKVEPGGTKGKQARLKQRPASPLDGSDSQGGQGGGGIVAAGEKGKVKPGDTQEGKQARLSRRPASSSSSDLESQVAASEQMSEEAPTGSNEGVGILHTGTGGGQSAMDEQGITPSPPSTPGGGSQITRSGQPYLTRRH